MNVENIFLNFGFVLVEGSRLGAFDDLPINIEICIMAWANVGFSILSPIYPAAQVSASIRKRQDRAIFIPNNIYPVAINRGLPTVNLGAIEIK